MPSKTKPVYSGDRSVKFWDRIHALEPAEVRDRLYGMGCELQNLEGDVLKALDMAELATECAKLLKKKTSKKRKVKEPNDRA